MLRPVSTIVLALVLLALAAPALLAASGPRTDVPDRPAGHRAFGTTHAVGATPHHPAAGAPTAVWATVGGVIDPDGVTTTSACQLESCGDVGGVTDPNGLTAAAPRHPAATAPTALWAAEGAVTDPDGLTALTPEPPGSLDLFLFWLRSLLSL